MNGQSPPDEVTLENLESAISAVNPDKLRRQIELIPDRRAQHFIITRYQTTGNKTQAIMRECRPTCDYLQFIHARDESLESITRNDVEAYFEYRNEFGLTSAVATVYRRALGRLHAHLWRTFGIQSVPPSTFLNGEVAEIIEETPYANVHPAEVRRLVSAASTQRDEIMILLMYYAALRVNSIIQLQISDYNRTHRCLLVEREGNLRRVPLLPEIDRRLRRWLKQKRASSLDPEAPLFPSSRGGYLKSCSAPSSIVKWAAENAQMQTQRQRPDGQTEGRLTTATLRRSGLDHWITIGVPAETCDYLTSNRPPSEVEEEPTSREIDEFETFRECHDL